jgi:hypothetical protein
VTGEHVRGVRDAGSGIEARELVPLTVLVLVLIGLLWVRTAKLVPSDPAYNLPRDHHMYAFMATYPVGSLHVAPWGWRLLGPAFARLFPGSVTVGFQLLAVGALSLTALAMFLVVRRLGFDRRLAIIGVVLFLSLGYAVKFNLYDFWLTDPLAFFFVAAALLCVVLRFDIGFAICLAIGVLSKESVFFVVGLHYGLRAKRPVDPHAALNTLLLALPAIAVLIGVRTAIPSWNGRPSYLASLPLPIRRNARTVPSYNAVDVLRATVERQDWGRALFDALTTFGITVGLLVVLGARAAQGLALRFAPFLVLVLSHKHLAEDLRAERGEEPLSVSEHLVLGALHVHLDDDPTPRREAFGEGIQRDEPDEDAGVEVETAGVEGGKRRVTGGGRDPHQRTILPESRVMKSHAVEDVVPNAVVEQPLVHLGHDLEGMGRQIRVHHRADQREEPCVRADVDHDV